MPICSYLVVPAPNRVAVVLAELSALAGCEAVAADEHDVIALVTETANPTEEAVLRSALQGIEDVLALVLTFGEIETPAGDS